MACFWGNTSCIEVMMDNAKFCRLNLNARTKSLKTGLQVAKAIGKMDVVNLILKKSQSFKKIKLEQEKKNIDISMTFK